MLTLQVRTKAQDAAPRHPCPVSTNPFIFEGLTPKMYGCGAAGSSTPALTLRLPGAKACQTDSQANRF